MGKHLKYSNTQTHTHEKRGKFDMSSNWMDWAGMVEGERHHNSIECDIKWIEQQNRYSIVTTML